ncbi:MAG: hypothetical protein QOD83_1868 [Solirubrobacteraceae bacterium]|nr:hypothetical protein [Solirubrobacteraceae bacterium]
MPEKVDLEVELPRANYAPFLARWVLKTFIADRVEAYLLTNAELLVSELANNALLHCRRHITLRASLDEKRLLVAVSDEGSGVDHDPGSAHFEQLSGWGLDLVEHISSRWGVHEQAPHVWFELELSEPHARRPRLREPVAPI